MSECAETAERVARVEVVCEGIALMQRELRDEVKDLRRMFFRFMIAAATAGGGLAVSGETVLKAMGAQ